MNNFFVNIKNYLFVLVTCLLFQGCATHKHAPFHIQNHLHEEDGKASSSEDEGIGEKRIASIGFRK